MKFLVLLMTVGALTWSVLVVAGVMLVLMCHV